MYSHIFIILMSLCTLILTVMILVKLNKRCEKYSSYDQPSPVLCAYALGGSNTAYCNDFLKSYRANKLCNADDNCNPNSVGKIDCEGALKCCNEINTCSNGQNCRDKKYMPTKENKLMYDNDIVTIR